MSTIDKAMAKLKGHPASESGDTEKDLSLDNPEQASIEASSTQVLLQEEIEDIKGPEAADEALTSDDSTATPPYYPELSQEEVQPEPEAEAETDSTADLQESSGRSSKYAEIDIDSLTARGFITPLSENRYVKEQFRAIKRKLLNNAFGAISKTLSNPNLIIISSCNPHEGKTFSAINLALNIALEQDKTVLLVDADVVRPSLTKELQLPEMDGLTEYLLGKKTDVSEIIHSTNIDNFKFIPAGRPHELSTELLASERMTNLTEELASRYHDRVVIFDAPPLLGVNETHVMANLVGQAVVVVEESRTKLSDVQVAVSQLEKKLAIGFLMNKSRGGAKDQYGYGYGYYNND